MKSSHTNSDSKDRPTSRPNNTRVTETPARRTPAKYVLYFDSKWMFEGATTNRELYTTMENWVRDLREMEKLGILPTERVEEGQTMFETNDPMLGKKYGFYKRYKEELKELQSFLDDDS